MGSRGIQGGSGSGGGAATSESYALLQERQAQSTDGGEFNSGADRKRDINTEVHDDDGIVSLASGVITLQAGTYKVRWWATAHRVGEHQTKFVNTDDSIEYLGSSESHPEGQIESFKSVGSCRFTITAEKDFELRHRCATNRSGDGFGLAAGFNAEVYAEVEILKEL